jgi:hypothetical protein
MVVTESLRVTTSVPDTLRPHGLFFGAWPDSSVAAMGAEARQSFRGFHWHAAGDSLVLVSDWWGVVAITLHALRDSLRGQVRTDPPAVYYRPDSLGVLHSIPVGGVYRASVARAQCPARAT